MSGNLTWANLNGTAQNDMLDGMFISPDNDIYLTGETYAAYPGLVSAGGRDIFLLYYPAE